MEIFNIKYLVVKRFVQMSNTFHPYKLNHVTQKIITQFYHIAQLKYIPQKYRYENGSQRC